MRAVLLMLIALVWVTPSSPAGAVDLTPLIKKIPRNVSSSDPNKIIPGDPRPDYTGTILEVRPCEKEDILDSMWRVVYSKEKPRGKHERMARLYKNQYLYMGVDGRFVRLRSSFPIDDAEEAKKHVKYVYNDDSSDNGAARKSYTLNAGEKQSELIFFTEKVPMFRHNCSIVKKKKSVFLPGDMILNGYTYGGKSTLYEIHRRWF